MKKLLLIGATLASLSAGFVSTQASADEFFRHDREFRFFDHRFDGRYDFDRYDRFRWPHPICRAWEVFGGERHCAVWGRGY